MSFMPFDTIIPDDLKWTKISGAMLADISTIILQKRLELGLTQKEMAEKFGISQGLLSKYENGDCNPTIRKLAQIFYSLGVEVNIRKLDADAPEEADFLFEENELINNEPIIKNSENEGALDAA